MAMKLIDVESGFAQQFFTLIDIEPSLFEVY
jgi:hypothetical protein